MATKRERVGDEMVVTTVERQPAVVKFDDIVKKAEEESEYSEPPWKEYDGYEHVAIKLTEENEPGRYSTSDKVRKGETYRVLGKSIANPEQVQLGQPLVLQEDVWVEHYNRDDVCGDRYARTLINVSPEQVTKWGAYAYHGASKQVQFEAGAEDRRRTIDQLTDWYTNGWYSWVVSIDYLGEYAAALGGILCDAGDPYLEEVARDLAEDIAAQMEKDGYTVTGKPDFYASGAKQKRLRSKVGYNLGFEDSDSYRRWVEAPPVREGR